MPAKAGIQETCFNLSLYLDVIPANFISQSGMAT
jgi:hypothetical protein